MLDDTAEEGVRLARAAHDAALPLRLFGGVAIWYRCSSARERGLRRTYADIDFVTVGRSTRAVSRFLESQGYEPDRLFNSLHSASRMTFKHPVHRRPIDVIVDQFQMCHTIDLREGFRRHPASHPQAGEGNERAEQGEDLTVPLTDLLLMKLQVVQLNDKDVRDALAILADHPVDQDGPDVIDVGRIRELTSNDWGFEHTIRKTLDHLRGAVINYGLSEAAVATLSGRIDALVAALDSAPKSLRWKLRAQVGERVRWYELPEEAHR
jgi:hypothetical protein